MYVHCHNFCKILLEIVVRVWRVATVMASHVEGRIPAAFFGENLVLSLMRYILFCLKRKGKSRPMTCLCMYRWEATIYLQPSRNPAREKGGWSTPYCCHFIPRKYLVSVRKAGWALEPVWTSQKSRHWINGSSSA